MSYLIIVSTILWIVLKPLFNSYEGLSCKVTPHIFLHGAMEAYRGNIVDVKHQRWFNSKNVKVSDVEIVVKILGESHAKEIIATLMKAAYETSSHAD